MYNEYNLTKIAVSGCGPGETTHLVSIQSAISRIHGTWCHTFVILALGRQTQEDPSESVANQPN